MLRFLGFRLLLLCFFFFYLLSLFFFSILSLFNFVVVVVVFFCNCCKKIYNNNNKEPGNRLKTTTKKVRIKSTPKTFNMFRFVLPCSQTLYFLFKVRRARVIKNKNRGGFADRQRKGLGVGKEKILYFSFMHSALVLARQCSRKERKEK